MIADAGGRRDSGPATNRCRCACCRRFTLARASPALIYLLNPTAGLMDGDGQLVELNVRAGTRALVVGQSATRIHPCLGGFATQQWHVRVETGAVLVVLSGPAIPFQGCRYHQQVDVELQPGAGFCGGRLAARHFSRGADSERFRFEAVIQHLTIRRAGSLVFRDRFCWRGPWNENASRWHFGDGTAAGTLFATGTRGQGKCGSDPSLETAAFRTAFGDTCLRYCGRAEDVTAAVVRTALTTAVELDERREPELWIPDSSLAPSHWFSPMHRSKERNQATT